MHKPLPTATPKSQGLDPQLGPLLAYELEKRGFQTHALKIVKNNQVVYQAAWAPYTTDSYQHFFSVSKSFMATAIGLAAAENFLTLDDLVLDYFKDVAPPNPNENLQQLKIRDLLTMSCGHEEARADPYDLPAAEYARAFLAHPFPHKPGTHFVYNTPGSNVLSILLQRATGQTLDKFLTPRLLEPLDAPPVKWSQFADWVLGGTGIHSSVDLITRFAILYLNEGDFYGKQILSPEWVKDATRKHVENGVNDDDWSQGYGYQFWRSKHGYRCDGAFCQLGLIFPEHNALVAITSGDSPIGDVLACVWETLVPHLDGSSVNQSTIPRLDLAKPDIAPHKTGTWQGGEILLQATTDQIKLTDSKRHDLTCTFDTWTTTEDNRWSTRASWYEENQLEVKRCDMSNGSWLHWLFDFNTNKGHVQEYARFDELPNFDFDFQPTP